MGETCDGTVLPRAVGFSARNFRFAVVSRSRSRYLGMARGEPGHTPRCTVWSVFNISYSDTARAVLRDGTDPAGPLPAHTSLHLPSIPNTPAPGAAPKNVTPPRAPPRHSSLAPKRRPRQPRVSSPYALRWASPGHPHFAGTPKSRVWESLGEIGRGLIWRTSPSSSLASSWAGAL